jgi:ubiquinone/menaquinone biosynthesis C-methylase UbiE
VTEEYYWDYANATTMGLYLDRQERSVVDEFLNIHTPRSCLDIACGSGRFSLSLMEKGIHVVAADRDPIPLKKLNNKILGARNRDKMIHIMQIDAGSLPFQDRTFDCILSIQTVSELNIQHFFSECNRILKDGGWLLFNEANRHSYKTILFRKFGSKSPFYRRSHSEICSLLADNNFKIERAVGMNWLPIKRNSNRRWTPFASKIERELRLWAFPSISPWVFYVAQKSVPTADDFKYNSYGDNRW